jgi:hypothetical protein
MGIVAEIDEGDIGQAPRDGIQNRQTAQTRIEDSDRHVLPFRLPAGHPARLSVTS